MFSASNLSIISFINLNININIIIIGKAWKTEWNFPIVNNHWGGIQSRKKVFSIFCCLEFLLSSTGGSELCKDEFVTSASWFKECYLFCNLPFTIITIEKQINNHHNSHHNMCGKAFWIIVRSISIFHD